jgi:hypothetical protein
MSWLLSAEPPLARKKQKLKAAEEVRLIQAAEILASTRSVRNPAGIIRRFSGFVNMFRSCPGQGTSGAPWPSEKGQRP